MIVPCIDLMDGKVVQLVQGREKALEGDSPDEMLRKFAAFPEIQVIDLDAAIGRGSNDDLVRMLAVESRHAASAAASAPSSARSALLEQGALRVIVGTAHSPQTASTTSFLAALRDAIGRDRIDHRARFQRRPHRRQRLAGSHRLHRRRSARSRSNPTAPASSAPMSTRKA